MNKIYMLLISLILCVSFGTAAKAADSSLGTQIDKLFAINDDLVMENLNQRWNAEMESYYPPDASYIQYKYPDNWERVVQEHINEYRDRAQIDWSKAVKFHYFENSKYLLQYIRNGCPEYLEDAVYWFLPSESTLYTTDGASDEYYETATYTTDYTPVKSGYEVKQIMNDESYKYLDNTADLESALNELHAGECYSTELLSLNGLDTILYLKCDNGNYASMIYESVKSNIPKPDIENFSVYLAEDLIRLIGERGSYRENWYDGISTSQMLTKKQSYAFEAEFLQSQGLLYGNENGLDLLKPLTRAEAVTLLIRALGLESEAVKYTTSAFTDIPSDNWASPYAALAKDKGIAAGISETEFAPNEPVTADQFAAFTLRAMGESNFDYTQGIEMLIDREIITADEAETMDLFTRGDMAKIVYEAREKGLL